MSYAQQRLWFLDQLEPGLAVYSINRAVRLKGLLNVGALERAIRECQERHEVLRTVYQSAEGNPVQVVRDNSAGLRLVDLATRSDEEREIQSALLLGEEAKRPFDLCTGPPFRSVLFRLRPDEHLLLLTMHHIASDGWSIGVLLSELASLYGAFSSGLPSPLVPLPVQYADFAVWQKEWLEGGILRDQLDYWKRQLAGAPELLELPTDHVRPSIQSYRGEDHLSLIPASLAAQLKALCVRERATPFMALLAAFNVLLWRYSGVKDLVVGSPIANRTRLELEGMIGFFANTIVFRSDLSGNPTFRELLKRERGVCLGAYVHQDLPFEKLVEELQPARNLSHTQIFQVMFAVQNTPGRSPSFPGLSLEPVQASSATAKFDITVTLTETTQGLHGIWNFCSDLFARSTIERMARHYSNLLGAIIKDPDKPISALPVHSAEEFRLIINGWNENASLFATEIPIHSQFELRAAAVPDSVAVVSGEDHLTYALLNARANRLASYLRALGVGRGDRVAICLERSVEMVIAILAVLKSGAAYVPLDPGYPAERLEFMLEDANAAVLITTTELGKAARARSVLCLDAEAETIARLPETDPVCGATADDLAYVIYTSGSTGRPKGVMIQHRAASNTLSWMQSQFPLSGGDSVLQKTPFSFDVSVCDLFGPLLAGARLVMAPPRGHQDSLCLVEAIRRFSITQIHLVPSMLRLLVDEVGFKQCSTLKDVFAAGEALAPDIVRQFHARTRARLHNVYGPTETAIYATWWTCSPGADRSTVPIGRPIANTQAYVLDADLYPVPIGVPGELYLGGAGLAAGYLGRPELTAEKFVPNPYGTAPGMRLYKTGDRARQKADGNIEFLGRTDHQVKLRGFRIELGEIEAVLGQAPDVAQSVVAVREDIPGDAQLIAYVVSRNQAVLNADRLREFASSRLPQFMVPAAYVFLDSLPHTPAGKLDRRALPVAGVVRPQTEFTRPCDTLELQLVAIWQEVLGVPDIGVRDDFFELGGHSLLAVRLLAQIEKYCGKRLPLATLFDTGTIEHQAELIRRENWTPPWTSLVPIQPGGARPPFFCVHAHDGHVHDYRYLAHWLGPDQPFYGLQARGLDGRLPPLTRVEDMAAHYVAEIRSFQPTGPYYLGANCAGGMIAFEMAQQLHRAGERVGLLALIDAHSPHCHVPNPKRNSRRNRLCRLYQTIYEHWGHLRLLPGRQKIAYILDEIRWLTGINPGTLRRPSRDSRPARENRSAAPIPLPPLEKYTPSVYPGRVTLFRPQKQAAGYDHDPEFGWGRVAAGGVDVHRIPGYDGIIHEPCVRLLAEQLSDSLRRAHEAAMTKWGSDNRETRGR